MEDFNPVSRMPLFKKIDRAIFERLDRFRLTPGYNGIQDFYNGLDEEQQKVFKSVVVISIFIVPLIFMSILWWQNSSIKSDLQTRIDLVSKANEIIGQRESLQNIAPNILSLNPIDGQSMMTSRVSNVLSSSGMDLSKIRIDDFASDISSGNIIKSEANLKFSNFSTDEMINMLLNLIQREKFRIQHVNISRNNDNNLLNGRFHIVHLSIAQNVEED
jgi:predicted XRE-type DNA-binding protein